MTNVPKLRELTDKLQLLLADPEPGVPFWHIAVANIAAQIGELGGPPAPGQISRPDQISRIEKLFFSQKIR